jgi:hypothetical protein
MEKFGISKTENGTNAKVKCQNNADVIFWYQKCCQILDCLWQNMLGKGRVSQNKLYLLHFLS